jgi:hypothetical protein
MAAFLLASLGSGAEDAGYYTWTATAVEYGNYSERLFVRRVGDDVFTHSLKSQRAGR